MKRVLNLVFGMIARIDVVLLRVLVFPGALAVRYMDFRFRGYHQFLLKLVYLLNQVCNFVMMWSFLMIIVTLVIVRRRNFCRLYFKLLSQVRVVELG